MSLLGHIRELRRRLIISSVFLFVSLCGSFYYARYVFEFLLTRVPPTVTFIYTDVTEMTMTYAKVSLYCGIALALPVFIYHIIMFIRPALNQKEKGYLYAAMPMIIISFLVGVAYAYFAVLPLILNFLINFKWIPEIGTRVVPMIKIGSFVSFTLKSLFWIGLVFEIPVLVFVLAKIGIVSHRFLLKHWRWIILGIFIFAALVTPTGTVVGQPVSEIILMDFGFIVSGPLLFLYILSIFLAWWARKPTNQAQVV